MLGTEYNCSLHTIHVGLGIVSLVLYIHKDYWKETVANEDSNLHSLLL